MKGSYLTILVSATAIGLGIATYSRLKNERQRKRLQSGNLGKVEQELKQRTDDLTKTTIKPSDTEVKTDDLTKTTIKPSDTEVKTVATSEFGPESEKVRRVRRYKSDGKPIYE
ncbi:MAG: hypothetical protein M3297_00605 [Thermoproteota archaeon]|nr:hypothetical protein [Thermoproteota archaeon]